MNEVQVQSSGEALTHVSRMMEEHRQLKVKIESLRTFIANDQEKPFAFLTDQDRLDLKEQLYHMENYHWVLGRRIGRTNVIENTPEKKA